MIARGTPQTFPDRIEHYRGRVADRIRAALDADVGIPSNLVEAIEYSVLGPGKRVRPLLTYATGELFDLDLEPLDGIAAAIELDHAYSLIHDDLPCMDDDDMRRGKVRWVSMISARRAEISDGTGATRRESKSICRLIHSQVAARKPSSA